jgi:hypothetical protein
MILIYCWILLVCWFGFFFGFLEDDELNWDYAINCFILSVAWPVTLPGILLAVFILNVTDK